MDETKRRNFQQVTQPHLLQSAWQFWFFQRPLPPHLQEGPIEEKPRAMAQVPYKDQLKPLGQIPSIEHFFNFYVYMKRPTNMPREIDLFFFREEQLPMWEESPSGGIWILKVKKDDNINKMWETLLFALIGEQFEEPLVIGASLSLRTKERLIQVWLKDGRNDKVRNAVSNRLRHILSLDPEGLTLYYKEHIKSIKDGSTMKNAEGFKFMRKKNETPSAQPWSQLGAGSSASNNRKDSFQSNGKSSQGRPQQQRYSRPSFEKLAAANTEQKVYRPKPQGSL